MLIRLLPLLPLLPMLNRLLRLPLLQTTTTTTATPLKQRNFGYVEFEEERDAEDAKEKMSGER